LLRLDRGAHCVGGGGEGRAKSVADVSEDMAAMGLDGLCQDLIVSP
jgi:hypothetical protein